MNEPHYATTFSLIATVTERKFCFPQTFTPTWRLHYDQALEMHNPPYMSDYLPCPHAQNPRVCHRDKRPITPDGAFSAERKFC